MRKTSELTKRERDIEETKSAILAGTLFWAATIGFFLIYLYFGY